MSLEGKTVLVTGASSGIGRALAIEAARQGARVGLIARRGDLLSQLAEEIKASGGSVSVAVADVRDRGGLQRAIVDLHAQLGPTDVLIANAGVGFPSGANPVNYEGVETMIQVNYLGVIATIEAVLPTMRDRRAGKIGVISSLAAYKGMPGTAGYCASKAAISTYSESLRIELRSEGITVTTVCPGFIKTPMTDRNNFPMPFLMTADRAAVKILHAVQRGTKVYNFPWIMGRLMKLTYWLPDWLMAKLATRPNFPEQ
jgi:short-subunit dehydrogenase